MKRITVSREKETLDCIAEIPEGIGGMGKKIAVGLGDGKIRFVRLGMNKVIGTVQHDEIEGVTDLGFDVGGRMISGGGPIVKVWREGMGDGEVDDENEEDDEGVVKQGASDDDDSDVDDDDDSSDEEEQPRKRRKKGKRGKGPAEAGNGLSFAGLD